MKLHEVLKCSPLKRNFEESLDLRDTQITELPEGLTVVGSLYLSYTKITELPEGLKVGGDLDLRDTQITELPEGLKVSGDLDLRDTKITELPEDLVIGGSLYLGGTQITELPKGLKVGGSLYLYSTKITEIPDDLVVGVDFYCNREKITKYPDNSVYLDKYFEKTNEGYIVYKTFNGYKQAPEYWNIKEGSIIEEPDFNNDRWESCGKGINVATVEWIKEHSDITKYPENKIWKCLLRSEWLETVNCPIATAGKIRCRKLELLETI